MDFGEFFLVDFIRLRIKGASVITLKITVFLIKPGNNRLSFVL